MNEQRPREVTPAHLARKAVVYVRQSTPKQVINHTGSTAYQRDQSQLPAAWGWPPDAIEVIDEDLGLTGTSTINRTGYLRLFDEVEAGLVGAIFVSDVSRIARETEDTFKLLKEMKLRGVLLVVDGKVQNPQDATQLLMTRLMAILAEYDNSNRRETMRRGLIKTAQNATVTAPPRGYVQIKKGSWELDPDAAVQEAVRAAFRLFRQHRSLRRTVLAMNAAGIQLPSRHARRRAVVDGERVPFSGVRWARPSSGTLREMIHHPAYKGDSRYLERQTDQTLGKTARGKWRLRKAPPGVTIINQNHHEAYVTVAEWDEMQAILKRNTMAPTHSILGAGKALLPGILRCSVHNLALRAHYAVPRRHYYQCIGQYLAGGNLCGSMSGRLVDRLVVEALLERLLPPKLAAVRQAYQQARSDEVSEQRRRRAALECARQEVTKLEDIFFGLDHTVRHVAQDVARRLDEAKAAVLRLDTQIPAKASQAPTFDAAEFDELATLCSDLPGLWNAPTTTNRDRKEIVRTVIERVWVEGRDQESVRLRIVWADGEDDRGIEVKRTAYVHRIMAELATAGLKDGEIAQQLNAMRLRTSYDNPWSKEAVQHATWVKRRRGQLPQQSNTNTAHLCGTIAELAAAGMKKGEIARRLNAMGLRTRLDRPWSRYTVHLAIRAMQQRGELPQQLNTGTAYIWGIIAEHAAAGVRNAEIAQRLNAMGLRTQHDRPWSNGSVQNAIWIMRRRGKLPQQSNASTAHAWRIIAELAAAGVKTAEIARRLNAMGLRTRQDGPWSYDTVLTAISAMQQRGELPQQLNTGAAYIWGIIAELAAAGVKNAEIAQRLNAMGLRTQRDRPWNTNNVHHAIWLMRRRGKLPQQSNTNTAYIEGIIAELAAAGGLKNAEIAQRLNGMGLRTPRRDRPWSKDTVQLAISAMRRRDELPLQVDTSPVRQAAS